MPERPARPVGRLFVWPGRALYVGSSTDAAEHRHHALQVAVGLGATFRLRADGVWREQRAAVIAGNAPHQFDGHGGRHLLLLLDPDSSAARGVARRHLGDRAVAALDATPGTPQAVDLAAPGDCRQAQALVARVVAGLLGAEVAPGVALHPLTDAAHQAGFADSAHLSRTFRQMFGLRMRDLFKNSGFVQVRACGDP